MRKIIRHTLWFMFLLSVLLPIGAQAHQPRLVTGIPVTVVQPEISKAYYGTLSGAPHTFRIAAPESFHLYVNILVPDLVGQKKDVSAVILKNGQLIAELDGTNFSWEKFFEPFGYDTYWKGPEYSATVDAGEYTIQVSSANQDSQYALAIGEAEAFNFQEIAHAYTVIPKLKRDFFHESPANFLFSPLGWGLVAVLYVLAFAGGFLYRVIMKHVARKSTRRAHKNIGKADRWYRLALAILLLAWAIGTSWNPVIIFLSGFVLFEAMFSWCGLYAALGRNTCPL